MQAFKLLILVSLGVFAGWLGFQAYPSGRMIGGLFAVFTIAWLLYRFTGAQLAWDTISWMTQPNMMFIVGLMAGVTYFMIEGGLWGDSWVFGLGAAFLLAAAGITFYNYWNIGS